MDAIYDKQGVTIYHNHSLFVLMGMASDSVDSIVTDPPYGLSFMGKKWDYDVPSVQLWREALRVLKPGGHLLSFAGSRTYHRMAVNIEDAGFEIRDQIMWIYGSGFPKSLDISKAIDKAAGVEREVIGTKENLPGYSLKHSGKGGVLSGRANGSLDNSEGECSITAPVTFEAQQWDGWGTALKPAHEPIVVARKPISGTVAENVLKHGTGGINIDGGRVGDEELSYTSTFKRMIDNNIEQGYRPDTMKGSGGEVRKTVKGRFPANIIFDPEAGAILDNQSGESMSNINKPCEYNGLSGFNGALGGDRPERGHNDSGGASRFFYCAKASKEDRDEGLEGMPVKTAGQCTDRKEGSDGLNSPRAGAGRTAGGRNNHPTVKPVSLMQYLVRLVTPPGGTVLDPFMGSGSTGKAAVREGFKFIGCDREAEYIKISIARIEAPAQVELL